MGGSYTDGSDGEGGAVTSLPDLRVMLQRVALPGARQGWDDRKGVSALALKSNVDEGEISNLPISPLFLRKARRGEM